MKNQNTSRLGFTLIELLVVVLIIGILASVALPQYQKAVLRARYKQVVILGDTFMRAQDLYRLENGRMATSFEELDLSFPEPINKSSTTSNLTFYYTWGYCSFRRIDSTNPDVQCRASSGSWPVYQVGLTAGRWMRICHSKPNDPLSYSICKAETGRQEPNYKASGWWQWDY